MIANKSNLKARHKLINNIDKFSDTWSFDNYQGTSEDSYIRLHP